MVGGDTRLRREIGQDGRGGDMKEKKAREREREREREEKHRVQFPPRGFCAQCDA